jgi:GDSL-like Lipase/Acylhydrolase family
VVAQALNYREREISSYLRLTRKAVLYLVTFLIITAGSIWLALQVAPMQTVSAAGQTAQVGAAIPSLSLKTVGAGLAVVVAVNIGGVLLTARSTPSVLRSVKTLDDLVGADPLQAVPGSVARPLPGVQAVVIGDSTAAAVGNPAAANASALDRACGRSSQSYAADLAAVNNWTVLNLACSGATIQNGLLGVQLLGSGQVAPAQLDEAQLATHAKVIIVSVGADDVEWSIMTRLCAASAVCNDKVSTAYFNQLLNSFTRSYYQLLGDLAALPGGPAVLVNEYYSPFGPNIGCLARYGLTPAKEKVLLARLGQLNTVLAEGAQTFGFGVADPPFTGHELCTADPYVQGPQDRAPLHPTAAGELLIALADQQVLPKLHGLVPAASALTPAPGTD